MENANNTPSALGIRGAGQEITIFFSSKEELKEEAEKILNKKWRSVVSMEYCGCEEDGYDQRDDVDNWEIILSKQSLYKDCFETIEDVVDFVYK